MRNFTYFCVKLRKILRKKYFFTQIKNHITLYNNKINKSLSVFVTIKNSMVSLMIHEKTAQGRASLFINSIIFKRCKRRYLK